MRRMQMRYPPTEQTNQPTDWHCEVKSGVHESTKADIEHNELKLYEIDV